MGAHKKKGSYTHEVSPAPIPDYHFEGVLTDICDCNYFYAGEAYGKPYYRRVDGLKFAWWYNFYGGWYITNAVGDPNGPGFHRRNVNIVGVFTPFGGATGVGYMNPGGH